MKKLSIRRLGGKLFCSEKGQALGEYAAMLGLILAILYLLKTVGQDSNSLFQRVVDLFHGPSSR